MEQTLRSVGRSHIFLDLHTVSAVGFQTNTHRVSPVCMASAGVETKGHGLESCPNASTAAGSAGEPVRLKSKASKINAFLSFKTDHLRHIIADGNICHPNESIQPNKKKKKQNSYSRISTFKWASASSSWLELEGEGVADLLPGGEGEPWGSALRLTCRFSWVSALMGLGSIGGELFIRAWLRL